MKTIEERIAAVNEFLNNYPEPKNEDFPTWDEFFAQLGKFLPQISSGENFKYENECDVEVSPWFDDEEDTWHTQGFLYDVGRDDEDGLYFAVKRFDGDCSWDDYETIYESEEEEFQEINCESEKEEFQEIYKAYFNTDDFFHAWANYYIWCAENGAVDPLKSKLSKEPVTLEWLVKAAEDNVKCLKM